LVSSLNVVGNIIGSGTALTNLNYNAILNKPDLSGYALTTNLNSFSTTSILSINNKQDTYTPERQYPPKLYDTIVCGSKSGDKTKVSITGAKGVLFAIAGGDDLGMLEVQDAARVITESIDPHAKVIFGAIRDEKLKKNELKVTVIATGFPEVSGGSGHGRPTFFGASVAAPQVQPAPQDTPVEKEVPRGRIFNSLPTPPPKVDDIREREEKKSDIPPPPPREPRPVASDDEDDDWGAVPAFLRRSKLK
jgi:hypothetical protein